MLDYKVRKQNLTQSYVKSYQLFLNDISKRLIKMINPEISTDDWMKDAKKYLETFPDTYKFYLETKKKPINSEIDKSIREYLKKFDYAVNPFQAENFCFDECENIFEILKLDGCIFNKDDGMERENCATLYLTDLSNNNYVKFSRTPDGFCYAMNYNISNVDEFTVIHYFANHYFEKFDNGEVVVFERYKKGKCLFNTRYNITQNTFEELYGKNNTITLEEKKFILDELKEAVKYSSSITIDRLQTNNKKLCLIKKNDK